MAYGDGTFRSRALSLLRPSLTSAHHSYADVNLPNGSKKSTDAQLNEKQSQNTAPNEIAKTQPYQSVHGNTVIHNREAQRIVRTIPGQSRSLTNHRASCLQLGHLCLQDRTNLGNPSFTNRRFWDSGMFLHIPSAVMLAYG